MSTGPVLSIRGLTVTYPTDEGPLTAIDDVSLEIAPGEAVGVVGESGSGKSTLAGAVLDLLGPGAAVERGSIVFEGTDLAALSRERRRDLLGRRIGSVFQDPFTSLNPSMRVGEQIAEPMIAHFGLERGPAMERARELLAELGIPRPRDVAAAFPHQLSGGMKQRALIAAALGCEPPLIILDEPTTALDVTIEAQILDLLAMLRERHRLSLMFISHNLAVIRRVCDRVNVLYAGQLVEQSPVDQLFDRPAHPYTKGLLASLPRIRVDGGRDQLTPIPGGLPDLTSPHPGCIFAPRCSFAEAACRANEQVLAEVSPGREARCWKAVQLIDKAWPRDATTVPEAVRAKKEATLSEVRDLAKIFRTGSFWDRLRIRRSETGGLVFPEPRRVIAVDRVSLDIHQGEVLGLVGESGCGKTTLGRCIVRLIEPSGGRITFNGLDVLAADRKGLKPFRRDAQIIFQNPDSSLNPRMTVRQIVARPLNLFNIAGPGETARRVDELLERVRLPASYARRYPHQLSGGEKQRVGIARALASNPRFIVCDEAVSALDVSVQGAIVNLLAELRAELGLALLFISHDISVVAHLADRIAVMYQGRICEIGPTQAILEPPYHPYTQALLSAAPQVIVEDGATTRIELPGEVEDVARREAQCPFHRRCPMKVGNICDTENPPWIEGAPGHLIACHHTKDTLDAMRPVVPRVTADGPIPATGSTD